MQSEALTAEKQVATVPFEVQNIRPTFAQSFPEKVLDYEVNALNMKL